MLDTPGAAGRQCRRMLSRVEVESVQVSTRRTERWLNVCLKGGNTRSGSLCAGEGKKGARVHALTEGRMGLFRGRFGLAARKGEN